jgi:hypothetical protein
VSYPSLGIDECIRDASLCLEGRQQFLCRVFSLVSEHYISCEREASQQPSNKSDVGLKHRQVNTLKQVNLYSFHDLLYLTFLRILLRL